MKRWRRMRGWARRDAPAAAVPYAMLSHPGRVRKDNQDTCAVDAGTGAFAVLDGMGGAAAGEVASQLAAAAFLKSLANSRPLADPASPRASTPEVRLRQAVRAANAEVLEHARLRPLLRGMGTTLTGLLLEPAPAAGARYSATVTLAHVGDSRCYLFRHGELEQLTNDHSVVAESVRAGELTAADAAWHPMRHLLTRAVGTQEQVEPDLPTLEPEPEDLLLLCTDGVTGELSDGELRTLLRRACRLQRLHGAALHGALDLHRLCHTLVDAARDAGGADNLSVLLVQPV